jgi:hypothetical protein
MAQHKQSQMKQKKKEKRKECQQRQIDENSNNPPLLPPLENSHRDLRTLERRIPSNIYKD